MKKFDRQSPFWATPEGIHVWESFCGFSGPLQAHKKLGIPLRTYCRYKADGLPNKLQREVILDRMESLIPKKSRGQGY